MAMAWITKATNITRHQYSIIQKDPTWHPIVAGLQYASEQPILVPALIPKGTSVPSFRGPFDFSFTTLAADMPGRIDLEYCVIPWSAFGWLRIVGPDNAWVELQVGNFVNLSLDHLRIQDNFGNDILVQELGTKGGAWWSCSYNFALIITDQGCRLSIEAFTPGVHGPVMDVVDAVSEILKTKALEILQALLKKVVI